MPEIPRHSEVDPTEVTGASSAPKFGWVGFLVAALGVAVLVLVVVLHLTGVVGGGAH